MPKTFEELYKENETSRSDYLAVNLNDHDIRYEALQEGAQNKAVENALTLILVNTNKCEKL